MARRLVATNGPDTMLSHDASYTLPPHSLSGFAKIQKHTRASVDPIARPIRLADQRQEPFVFDGPIRERLVHPGVEPAADDSQNPAQRPDWESIPIGMDEGVLYSGSLAKYAAAFFRMSRSS